MEYVLLIHSEEAAWGAMPPAEQQAWMAAYAAYTQDLIQAGVMRGGHRLQPAAEASLVRQGAVQAGPRAGAGEQLGGLYVIEVPDHAAALDWARRCPGSRHGMVELRPVMAPPSPA
ncbi:YciI family protein [Paracraurococcus ruber]|uniref:YCII-related domain-containing protein n=1 Tax=Paracraurococcus ruber TaxID=77675 RepID=A0ABS1CUV2_9PROT|nr:YciI family protein [Paracraurococcus ruber]MBK1658164.1 hypothetical protein [Paracraurococcus ruber]TDG28810.1 YciI family protein [Paracraurococcus ruber]